MILIHRAAGPDPIVFRSISCKLPVNIRRQIDIVHHIIFYDFSHLHLCCSSVVKFDPDQIPGRYIQRIRSLFTQRRPFRREIIICLCDSVPESHKFIHTRRILRHIQLRVMFLLSVNQRHILRVDSQGTIHALISGTVFRKSILNLLILLRIYRYLNIIKKQFSVLALSHHRDRILQSITHQHQRHTPSDADYRHQEPLFITEQVANRGFPCKIQMFPQKRNPFHQHPFAALRRFRPHQLSRLRPQFPVSRRHSRDSGAADTGRHSQDCLIHIERHQIDRKPSVQSCTVSIHNNPGNQYRADQHAQDTSPYGRRHGIAQIFPGNNAVSVSQCLQRTDGRSLFFHHTRHGSQADQRRDQEKHDRKDIAKTAHPVRIHLIAHIGCNRISSKHIPGGNFQVFQFPLSVCDLFSGIRDLLSGIRCFFIIFPLAVFQIFLRVLQLRAGVGQRLFSVCDLLPGIFQFLQSVFIFGFRLIQSRALAVQFCDPGFQFLFSGIHFFLRIVQLCVSLLNLLFCLV